MLDLELAVEGEVVFRFLGDGLILSSPVGSTAHSLSAGGPILGQELEAFVITPICGHTLTSRPLVDSADTCLEIVVARPHATTNIVTDGRVLGQIQRGDRVAIRASSHRFRMLAVAGQNEYRTLREKLGWGGSVLR